VLRAPGPAVRVRGIQALQAVGSDEALDQLLRVLHDDPTVLNDDGEYQALAGALASYRAPAKAKLLERFAQVSPSASRGAAAPPGDLFERYFSAGFEGLKSEINGGTVDPVSQARGLERLQAAQAELKQALRQVETSAPTAESSRLPGLVLQTFLHMDVTKDPELLAFARRTAADAAWSDDVRGQALLLIAKLGGKDDLEGLLTYLESPSPLLQARALQAIAALQSKVSPAAAPAKG
jgi:HEAT repeat protein